MKKTIALTCGVAIFAAAGLAGCAPQETKGNDTDTSKVTYSLWDPNQKPAYEACAAEFKRKVGLASTFSKPGGTITGRI